MHTTTLPARVGALLSAALLSACASTTPHWDARFGDSVRALNAQQVARPQASANADPVAGLDGRAARAAVERYERSLPEPKAASAPMSQASGK
jgi:hypothetical protein